MDKYIVSSGDINERLDIFITKKNEMTRSLLHKHIISGAVTVNDKVHAKNYRLRIGDIITIDFVPAVPLENESEAIALDIVYEDGDIIVINKPRGMVVHPSAGHRTGTLVNALLHHCGGSLSGIGGVMRPGIVHRLDKDTSGLLVAAKHDRAHNGLKNQWAEGYVKRVYHAICEGSIKQDAFTIDKPIGRHPVNRKKMAVFTADSNQKIRYAVTHIKVLEWFNRYTLAEARLETGRTHQIRVHLASAGHPIAGDVLYGRKHQKINAEGQLLHAKKLIFTHPVTNKCMEFETEWPIYFKKALSKISSGL